MNSEFNPRSVMENLPHYKDKYEAAKKTNVYFLPGYDDKRSTPIYYYALASALLHDQMVECLNKHGIIPNFAVIVEKGDGQPTQAVKDKIKAYYGFDHDKVAC